MKKLDLRPYQRAAVSNTIQALNKDSRALVVAPTGSGKTEILCGLVRELPAHARVLVIQHLVDLVEQNASRINAYEMGRAVVTLASSLPAKRSIRGDASRAGVVVGTVQTLKGALKYIGRFDVLAIDEAHHSDAEAFRTIIAHLKKHNPALRVLGLTATPERSDRRGLDWLFGETPAVVITMLELIEGGYLVPPRVLAVPLEKLQALRELHLRSDEDQSKSLNIEVVHSEVIRTWRKHAENRQTVFFCTDVAHAEGLADAFNTAGISAGCVSYQTPAGKRGEIMSAFAEGRGVKVLTNALLLTEGFNAPPVSCVGILRTFASKSLLIQGVGRGLRLAKGKRDCLALDYVAAAERHGDLVAGLNLKTRKRKQGIEREADGAAGGRDFITLREGDADLKEFDALGVKVNFIAREPELQTDEKPAREMINGREVISWTEANALGIKRYFTGRPCKSGHISERLVSDGNCVRCQAIKTERHRKNPVVRARRYAARKDPVRREKIKEYMQRYFQDPVRREKAKEYMRRYFQDPVKREKMRAYQAKYRLAQKEKRNEGS